MLSFAEPHEAAERLEEDLFIVEFRFMERDAEAKPRQNQTTK